LKKYELNENYFITPNQFWPHKNHMIILEAANKLIKEGFTNFNVTFTGKMTSYRDQRYTDNLLKYITENKLEQNVKFLGFIPRQDQLNLMNYSIAIIQPSLFEGWSTLVEEAKAMMLSVWDSQAQETLRIDLWTKEMMLDEMKHFFYQSIITMSDTYERATNDKEVAQEMREFGKKIGEKMLGDKK